MIDGHIYIERGDYTLAWIEKFVDQAVKMQLSEIRLLEHNYLFEEFTPMYASVCDKSEYVASWFKRSAGKHKMIEYFEMIDKVRTKKYTALSLASRNALVVARVRSTNCS